MWLMQALQLSRVGTSILCIGGDGLLKVGSVSSIDQYTSGTSILHLCFCC